MTNAEAKLAQYFETLMLLVEKSSKSEEDSILLAGAMMSVARVLYFDNLTPYEAKNIMDANTIDLIDVIKPTIH
jgi:hypothetical protein|tara:strand:- start:5550 stop:5771 length:222 start_codon:yes stop_codon:yes gene_type:complete